MKRTILFAERAAELRTAISSKPDEAGEDRGGSQGLPKVSHAATRRQVLTLFRPI